MLNIFTYFTNHMHGIRKHRNSYSSPKIWSLHTNGWNNNRKIFQSNIKYMNVECTHVFPVLTHQDDFATTHSYQHLYSISFLIANTCSIFNAYTTFSKGWPFYCSATSYTNEIHVRCTQTKSTINLLDMR